MNLFTDEERGQIKGYREAHGVSLLAAIDAVVKAREPLKEREVDALERIAAALENIETHMRNR